MENLTWAEVVTILAAVLMGLCGAVVTIGTAVEKVAKLFRAAKAPEDMQDKRLSDLEDWRKEVDRKLGSDKAALESIQEGNHAMYQALLALLDHSLDGNNIKQMQDAKHSLQEHLINK